MTATPSATDAAALPTEPPSLLLTLLVLAYLYAPQSPFEGVESAQIG